VSILLSTWIYVLRIELFRHKYTLFISADGNFKLQRNNKREDPDDFALNDGNAYFVPNDDYKAYMDSIGVKGKSRSKSSEEASSHLISLFHGLTVRFSQVLAAACWKAAVLWRQSTLGGRPDRTKEEPRMTEQ
jgi:hypothetical protein